MFENAHAYINAAFKIPRSGNTIVGRPTIVIGGISAETIHATETEDYLTDKTLSQKRVVKRAYRTLRNELTPEVTDLESSAKHRKDLAAGLLYKTLLAVVQSKNSTLNSGADHMTRDISSGQQTFQEKPSEFPLKKGMPKITAPLQGSGEAIYTNDLPRFNKELYAAFVVADEASATLGSLDASEALSMPGVSHFLAAKDIVGQNNVIPSTDVFPLPPHELFATETVSYVGQAVGLILADSPTLATEAAKKVKISYSDVRTPSLSVDTGFEVVPMRITKTVGDPQEEWETVAKTVEGTIDMGSQYHFFMETQVAVAVPSEDGMDLYCSTQVGDLCQPAAAGIIDKPNNYINLTVPRLGGGFGGKLFNGPTEVASAATLAAYLTKRPVRLATDLANTIRAGGKRPEIKVTYKAGFNKKGRVKVIDVEIKMDCGALPLAAGVVMPELVSMLDMAYYVKNWNIVARPYVTNKAIMTAVRAPGAVPAALIIETIMEHVAQAVGRHPIKVKVLNLYDQSEDQTDLHGVSMANCTIRKVWRTLKEAANVDVRIEDVDNFNKENLWRKRGITLAACKYGLPYFPTGQGATVSIFSRDGSVVICQGGVEMGQGLYTKVAQGVAQVLGTPLENIKVRPNNSIATPNAGGTGGSIGSEISMQAAIGAAMTLRERMRPIREQNPDASWAELCGLSFNSGVNLTCSYRATFDVTSPIQYSTYCAAVTETEVDVLTGESQIRRVDMVADFGESLNPVVDIGQAEGSYVMGLGVFLTERMLYKASNGQVLTDGTWNYKPPTTKDIPIDWRVHLLPDTPNPSGIRSSKASGEPAVGLSVGAVMANKLAIQACRKDLFGVDDFIPVVTPFTVDRAQQSLGLTEDELAM